MSRIYSQQDHNNINFHLELCLYQETDSARVFLSKSNQVQEACKSVLLTSEPETRPTQFQAEALTLCQAVVVTMGYTHVMFSYHVNLKPQAMDRKENRTLFIFFTTFSSPNLNLIFVPTRPIGYHWRRFGYPAPHKCAFHVLFPFVLGLN